jgi:hypothetical protein
LEKRNNELNNLLEFKNHEIIALNKEKELLEVEMELKNKLLLNYKENDASFKNELNNFISFNKSSSDNEKEKLFNNLNKKIKFLE